MNTIQRVHDLLQQRNMSLYQLTQISGISYSTIQTAERRGGQLNVNTIERICCGLGISLSDFFKTQDPKTKSTERARLS